MTAPYSAALTPVHKATERLQLWSLAAMPRLGVSPEAFEALPYRSDEHLVSVRTSLFLEHCSFLC